MALSSLASLGLGSTVAVAYAGDDPACGRCGQAPTEHCGRCCPQVPQPPDATPPASLKKKGRNKRGAPSQCGQQCGRQANAPRFTTCCAACPDRHTRECGVRQPEGCVRQCGRRANRPWHVSCCRLCPNGHTWQCTCRQGTHGEASAATGPPPSGALGGGASSASSEDEIPGWDFLSDPDGGVTRASGALGTPPGSDNEGDSRIEQLEEGAAGADETARSGGPQERYHGSEGRDRAPPPDLSSGEGGVAVYADGVAGLGSGQPGQAELTSPLAGQKREEQCKLREEKAGEAPKKGAGRG